MLNQNGYKQLADIDLVISRLTSDNKNPRDNLALRPALQTSLHEMGYAEKQVKSALERFFRIN